MSQKPPIVGTKGQIDVVQVGHGQWRVLLNDAVTKQVVAPGTAAPSPTFIDRTVTQIIKQENPFDLSQALRTGVVGLPNGCSGGIIGNLALPFTPLVCPFVGVPAGGLPVVASVVAGSESADGFAFQLYPTTNSTGYLLGFVLSNLASASTSGVLRIASPSGNTVYVSPAGGGDGSSAGSPTTMGAALASVSPGDTIIALDGTYASELAVEVANLTIRSQNRWGAKISGGSPFGVEIGYNTGAYGITLDGLQIANSSQSGVAFFSGANTVRNCWIYGSGASHPNQSGSAIVDESEQGHQTLEFNLLENNGWDEGGPFDHGIYLTGPDNVARFNVCRGNWGCGIAARLTSGTQRIYGNLIYANHYYGLTLNGSDAAELDYVYGNTILQLGSGVAALAKWAPGTVRYTNNIILSDIQIMNTGAATVYADYNVQGGGGSSPLSQAHGVSGASLAGLAFVNAAHGLYWLASGSVARGVADASTHGDTDFFGTALASVSDAGAFQYAAAYAADARTLDPSPGAGADYWLKL